MNQNSQWVGGDNGALLLPNARARGLQPLLPAPRLAVGHPTAEGGPKGAGGARRAWPEGAARQLSLEIPSHSTERDLIKRACWKGIRHRSELPSCACYYQ